jgi:hypothetical protein
MKKLLFLAFITGVTLFSCSKKSTPAPQPQTPIQAAIDAKYIQVGTTDKSLVVEYSTYNPNADCDKKVFDAAMQTVQGSSGINQITIIGTNLTMDFDRDSGVMPSKVSLTYGTALYKAVNQSWPWKGLLTIKKQNTLLTPQQFDADLSVTVTAVNTGDVAGITSKTINGDYMSVEYGLSKSNPEYSQAVLFQVQASTPITLTTQFEVNCTIPGFYDTQTNVVVDYPKSLPGPTQKDVGNNTISYNQEANPSLVATSLSASIALQYFVKDVYPLVN